MARHALVAPRHLPEVLQDTDLDFWEEGGVATQNYFYCENPEDGGPKLLVANAAAFHSGLSREGINATEAAKELNWFAPVRRALREVTGHHIRAFSREKKGFCPCGLTEIKKHVPSVRLLEKMAG